MFRPKFNQIENGPEVLQEIADIKKIVENTEYLASLSLPSETYETIICNNQWDTYIVPADGYISVSAYNNGWGKVGFSINAKPDNSTWGNYKAENYCGTSDGSGWQGLMRPVKKNDVVYFNTSGDYLSINRRFYYNIGSAKKLGLID